MENYALPVKEIKIYPHRIRRGEQNGFAVLTEDNVRAIRKLAETWTYKEIAKRYGIHKDTVYRIVNFKRWAHVKN